MVYGISTMSPYDLQCFMNAYQYNPMMFQGLQNAAAAGSPSSETKTEEQAAEYRKKTLPTQKNSSSKALGVIGFVGAASVIAASVMGKGKGLAKTGDGYKQMGNWISKTWKNIFGGTKASETATATSNAAAGNISTTHFTIGTINGKKVCTVPGRTHRISKNVSNELKNLGYQNADISPNVTETITCGGKKVTRLADGIKLNHYTFEHKAGGKTLTVTVKDGKITSIKDSKGKEVSELFNPVKDADIKIFNTINKRIANFQKGENINKLKTLKFSHSDNGLIRIYEKKGSGMLTLKGAITDRYTLTDDVVQAHLVRNSAAKSAQEAFSKREFDKLKIESAEYTAKVGGNDVTFLIKDDEIGAIKIGKYTYKKGSDKFDAMKGRYSTSFENVLKNQKSFKNVVYSEK